jgi:hypothetical protein
MGLFVIESGRMHSYLFNTFSDKMLQNKIRARLNHIYPVYFFALPNSGAMYDLNMFGHAQHFAKRDEVRLQSFGGKLCLDT